MQYVCSTRKQVQSVWLPCHLLEPLPECVNAADFRFWSVADKWRVCWALYIALCIDCSVSYMRHFSLVGDDWAILFKSFYNNGSNKWHSFGWSLLTQQAINPSFSRLYALETVITALRLLTSLPRLAIKEATSLHNVVSTWKWISEVRSNE